MFGLLHEAWQVPGQGHRENSRYLVHWKFLGSFQLINDKDSGQWKQTIIYNVVEQIDSNTNQVCHKVNTQKSSFHQSWMYIFLPK